MSSGGLGGGGGGAAFQGGTSVGGVGGFGGGGGGAGGRYLAGTDPAGAGGFGGGGGGVASSPAQGGGAFGAGAGAGGFGAGAGASGGGGGGGFGGAFFNNGGTLTITNSTLTGNSAAGGVGGAAGGGIAGSPGDGFGGAVFNRNGIVTILNSTIALNTTTDGGGVVGSGDAGGIFTLGDGAGGATLTLTNTIVSGSIATGDVVNNQINAGTSTLTATTPNIVQTAIVTQNGATTNGGGVLNVNPQLAVALANNGGPTQTLLPGAGSLALGGGVAGVTNVDQRGSLRPATGSIDLGSVQISPTTSTSILSSSLNPALVGDSVTLTATVLLDSAAPGFAQGTVTFFDGGVQLGVPVTLVNGQASITTSPLPPGNRTITATYNPAINFNATASNAAPFTQVVLASPNPSGTVAKIASVTSTTASGKYKAGAAINVTVNFDSPVTLTSGNLIVNLDTGGSVIISPFSNKTSVSGTYTVAPGQNSQSLNSTSLVVSGGTLQGTSGGTVTLAIPLGKSLSSSVNLLIDTRPPTVSISSPSAPATATAPITYTIIYADTNFNTNTLTAADITLHKTGTANGTVSVSGGVGTQRTVTISNITGVGSLGISLVAGTASDTAGNLAPAAGPSETFNVVNVVPAGPAFAVGGANGVVRLLGDTGTLVSSVTPITGYTGLVSVALGDFNGDTVADLATAAANPAGLAGLTTSQAGKVFVYDGAALAKGTLTLLRTFTPFATSSSSSNAYTNGLNIAAGDINGDGKVDLVAGSRGGNGTTAGQIESGRLVVIDGTSPSGANIVIGSIQTPFSAGYQKGVIVAVGDVDGDNNDEIAVTRGGPVNSPNAAVQRIKVKVLQLQGTALAELHLSADGSTAFAPFAGLSGAANAIKRDGRVAFVDTNGDGKDELVFSALDPLTDPTNKQVRVGVFSINVGATSGAATIISTGPNSGTYTTGKAVVDHAIAHVAATGTQQNIALLAENASPGVVYLAPLTGEVRVGGFSLSVVNGGITLDGI